MTLRDVQSEKRFFEGVVTLESWLGACSELNCSRCKQKLFIKACLRWQALQKAERFVLDSGVKKQQLSFVFVDWRHKVVARRRVLVHAVWLKNARMTVWWDKNIFNESSHLGSLAYQFFLLEAIRCMRTTLSGDCLGLQSTLSIRFGSEVPRWQCGVRKLC